MSRSLLPFSAAAITAALCEVVPLNVGHDYAPIRKPSKADPQKKAARKRQKLARKIRRRSP